MGLHTKYLGHVVIEPVLAPAEVDFLRSFNATRHCGDISPLTVAGHPEDNDRNGDVDAYNRQAPGMPGLWCPWSCCSSGCCLHWDGAEKPYNGEQWLCYLIDTFLRPGAVLSADAQARGLGLTFDHVLSGMLVGERQETSELFALEVARNKVIRRVLVAGTEGADEWGYRGADEERQERRARLAARRRRYETALAQDRAALG